MTLSDQNNFGLQCQGVSHWFGETKVLFDLNLNVHAGQFVSLIGPSGCGKSTLLRAILGTHPPHRGKILTLQNGAWPMPIGRDATAASFTRNIHSIRF